MFRGKTSDVRLLKDAMSDRSQIIDINNYKKPGIYWSNILACMEEHTCGEESVVISDSSWFKAYSEWDTVVDEVRSLCSSHRVEYSYARIGEEDSDYESDSSMPEGYIHLERSFDMPDYYSEIIDD